MGISYSKGHLCWTEVSWVSADSKVECLAGIILTHGVLLFAIKPDTVEHNIKAKKSTLETYKLETQTTSNIFPFEIKLTLL